MASPSGPNISAEQVFNKKFLLNGVKELKQKISGLTRLTAGATIFWLDRLTDTSQEAKASKRLGGATFLIESLRRLICLCGGNLKTNEVFHEAMSRHPFREGRLARLPKAPLLRSYKNKEGG